MLSFSFASALEILAITFLSFHIGIQAERYKDVIERSLVSAGYDIPPLQAESTA